MDKKEILAENEMIKEVITELQKFSLEIYVETVSLHKLIKALSDSINHLITNDFSRFISILYRMDISEKRLQQLLKESVNTSAGDIIAEMIIKRQAEKIKTRKLFTDSNIVSDEEKW
jgi:uncharacterized membrane protein YkgB